MPRAIAWAGPADRDGRAVDADRARVRREDTREDLDQRRLAGAVLTYQRHHLAAVEREVDATQGLGRAECLAQRRHL